MLEKPFHIVEPKKASLPEGEVLHIGQVKRVKGLFGKIDLLFGHTERILRSAFSVLTLQHVGEARIKTALANIHFDYLEQILRRVVQNSFHVSGSEYQNFTITKESVTCDNSLGGIGGANSDGYLKINPSRFGKSAQKYSMSDENIELAVALVVAHEAIHLLARKKDRDTGFTRKKDFTSANEAMTEILARAVGRAYSEFTNTGSREGWLYYTDYHEDIRYLLALMAIIARDNQVSIDVVIQAFTASYFCDDTVLDSFSQFANISNDAEKIVQKLRAKDGNESEFDIDQFEFDIDTRNLIERITGDDDRNAIVRRALHI